MNQLMTVKLCTFVLLVHGVVCAQDPGTLLAEGDYVAVAKGGNKLLSHWKLWHLNNGEYEVIDSSARNVSAIQTFRFDSRFMPIGFSKKAGPVDIANSRLPKVPGYEISCEYKAKELICETVSADGTRSTQTVPALPPYVLIGEFYDLDFTWFMTGVVHLASSEKTHNGLVNVYALTDGKNPTEIGLRPDTPIQITSDGDGTALAMGRVQPVKKYKWEFGSVPLVVGTDQGLIVKMTMTAPPETGFAIDNYKEYERWGVPFGDISNVAASSAATAMPEIASRVQVPSGVMIGLLVHRVPPVYPTAAKLNKVQGKVVLDAVIDTEGKVTEVHPMSGPQELISAAMGAVKEWQFKPYISQGRPVQVDTQVVVNFALPK
jgi:TonB family protein